VRKSLLAASLAPAGGAAAALRRGVLTLDLKKVAKLAAPADTYVVARL
jgi:HSP20 family molecular chaperone IbpA